MNIMAVKFVIFISILIANISGAYAQKSNSYDSSLVSQIRELIHGKNLILVGEAAHLDPKPLLFTRNLLCDMGHLINYVGLELSESKVAGLLNGELKAEDIPKYSSENGTSVIFDEILSLIDKINIEKKRLKQKKLQTIGLDVAQNNIVSFKYRDAVMATKISSLKGPGLVHIGAAHVARESFHWPKVFIDAVDGLPPTSTPAGKLLQKNSSISALYLLVGGLIDMDEYEEFIPKEIAPFWEFINTFEKDKDSSTFEKDKDSSFLVSTDNQKYQERASLVLPKNYKGIDPVSAFDYFVFMQDSIQPIEKCSSLEKLQGLSE